MPVLDNFSIGTQGDAGNLCWAAVGQGIAKYYDQLTGSTVRWGSMCEFVDAVLSQHFGTSPDELQCCEDQRILGPDCNELLDFRDALDVTGNTGTFQNLPLKFDQIKTQIDAKCPIGVEIQTSGNNHIIVLFGYDETNGEKVMVGDPAPDASLSSLVPYDDLVNNYRGAGGKWTQTYCTVANT
ncbi:MAG TPA: papain-like cysteine protease family protein [Methylomirabilota bacterium]|nr:papain-like cysteine protease family protein [Methylomirabilota bacterium]